MRMHGRNRGSRRFMATIHHQAFSDLLIGRRILDELAESADHRSEAKVQIGNVNVQLATAYKDRVAAVAG